MISYTFSNPEGKRYLSALNRYFKKHIIMLGFPETTAVFGREGIFYRSRKVTSVASISPDGYPILKPFWWIKSDLFKNQVSVKFNKKSRNLTEHQKNLKTYSKNASDLAFILPNGLFVFRESNETLNDTAQRILVEYPELQDDYAKWCDEILAKNGSVRTDIPETAFLVNFCGAIAFHECKALIYRHRPHYHSHLTNIWEFVLLFTDFFPHIKDVVEINLE